MATLLCKQCNFENEGERIYCHNCGAKLDRTVLPEEATPEQKTAKTRKRVMKLTKPARGFFAGWPKLALNTFLWAILAAGVIQAARAPDNVPPMPKTKELEEVAPIAMKLEQATMMNVPQQILMSENVINTYLRQAIKARSDAGYVQFDRAFVNLGEGVCRITTQQSVIGFPLYASTLYELAIRDNHLASTNVGGAIGRLPVHPTIMQFSDMLFQKLWDALSREHKLLDGMRSIEVHKDHISATTKGSLPAR